MITRTRSDNTSFAKCSVLLRILLLATTSRTIACNSERAMMYNLNFIRSCRKNANAPTLNRSAFLGACGGSANQRTSSQVRLLSRSRTRGLHHGIPIVHPIPPPTSFRHLRNHSRISYHQISSISDKFSINPEGEEDEQKIFNELKTLTNTIQEHDRLYYTPGLIPQLTDDEYDALIEREADLCKRHPDILKRLEVESGLGSKVSRFGGRVGPIIDVDTAHVGKRIHLENDPMQSLDNAMIPDGVVKWINRIRKTLYKSDKEVEEENELEEQLSSISKAKRIQIIAEPKMDGLSLSLRYIRSNKVFNAYDLAWGSTRGDGKRGEDVTDAVNAIDMIPKSFLFYGGSAASPSFPEVIEVRGEIVLPTSTFVELMENSTVAPDASSDVSCDDNHDENGDILEKQVNASGPLLLNTFSNARNAASGILLRRKSKSDMTAEEIENTKLLRSYLRFYSYSIAFSPTENEDGNDPGNQYYSDGIGLRNLLTDIGFTVPNPCEISDIMLHEEEEVVASQCQTLFDYHEAVMSNRNIRSGKGGKTNGDFDFDVDGAVYKVSSVTDRRILGSSSRFPRWAIAHKFPAQCAVTQLQNVEVQIGRTGALTPVAVLDPVELGGVTVSRASLHNFQYAQSILKAASLRHGDIDNSGVKKGASVMISRAGDVIPQVLQRLEDDMVVVEGMDMDSFISLSPPSRCPACGSETIFDVVGGRENKARKSDLVKHAEGEEVHNSTDITESAASIGQVLRCGGPQLLCPPRAVSALSHAFSRAGLDVSGLSEARLQQLVDAKLIRIPADLFRILDEGDGMFQNITALPGWGEKSARNLKSQVQRVATDGTALDRFIYSLGIRHVGTHSSSLIASAYGSSSDFLEALENASKIDYELSSQLSEDDADVVGAFPILTGDGDREGVKGIGPVVIESLETFAKNEELANAARNLSRRLLIHDEMKINKSTIDDGDDQAPKPFKGKSVVFTGSLPGKMMRSAAQKFAMDILGAKSTPSSVSKATGVVVVGEKGGKKAEKARELGIQIMSAEDFVRLVEKHR